MQVHQCGRCLMLANLHFFTFLDIFTMPGFLLMGVHLFLYFTCTTQTSCQPRQWFIFSLCLLKGCFLTEQKRRILKSLTEFIVNCARKFQRKFICGQWDILSHKDIHPKLLVCIQVCKSPKMTVLAVFRVRVRVSTSRIDEHQSLIRSNNQSCFA